MVTDYKDFISYFEDSRVIYLSLPAGPTVDSVVSELLPYLRKGDVVVDGGNSFYLDYIRREKELFERDLFSGLWNKRRIEGAIHGVALWSGEEMKGLKLLNLS